MLNSNFCKMFKNRLNLRKVATIVACLAVTTMFVACDSKNPNDDDDGNGYDPKNPIVGMWRSSFANNSFGATVGVVFFNADGTYAAIRYRYTEFIGEKGKYILNGDALEVSDLSCFYKGNGGLPYERLNETLHEGWEIIGYGTRSEVLKIYDPNDTFWQYHTESAIWYERPDWTETIEWIDNNTIDYPNGLINKLERVK